MLRLSEATMRELANACDVKALAALREFRELRDYNEQIKEHLRMYNIYKIYHNLSPLKLNTVLLPTIYYSTEDFFVVALIQCKETQ